MNKKVSVIIPTYGGPDFLERCINSVLTQTYNNIEVVVVDDNGLGTEQQLRTEEVMKVYADDARVKYVCHQNNINGSAARNTGVKNADGEFIALLDDDDIFYPEKIKRQVELLDSLPDIFAATYCSCEIYNNGIKTGETSASKSGNLLYECLSNRVQMASTSLLIRKSAFLAIGGFDESFRRHQDWEFRARLAAQYNIQADDFIGFRRILVFRNSLNTAEIYKERREHFLKVMEPLINTLPCEQRKEIYVHHRMEIALMFLKRKQYVNFVKEILSTKQFWECFKFLLKRFVLILKRGKLQVLNQ